MKTDPKRIMILLSIVERSKGTKLIKKLASKDIRMHYQCVGFGTAPTEMMDIFGLGTNDKDVVISLAPETTVRSLMADFGNNFSSYTEFGGLLILLRLSAAGRLLTEILHHNLSKTSEEGDKTIMKNEHHHNLIFITVDRGYADEVMQTAKRAGATGGTILHARLADAEYFSELAPDNIEEEREIICILAPAAISAAIMEDVNKEFGLSSPAHGTLCALPVEKAYKI